MREPFVGVQVSAVAEPCPASCYTSSGEAGVLVLRFALMTRVQLAVERFINLEHFEGVLLEQHLLGEREQQLARQHFAHYPGAPLDVILPAVDVGPKKGSA